MSRCYSTYSTGSTDPARCAFLSSSKRSISPTNEVMHLINSAPRKQSNAILRTNMSSSPPLPAFLMVLLRSHPGMEVQIVHDEAPSCLRERLSHLGACGIKRTQRRRLRKRCRGVRRINSPPPSLSLSRWDAVPTFKAGPVSDDGAANRDGKSSCHSSAPMLPKRKDFLIVRTENADEPLIKASQSRKLSLDNFEVHFSGVDYRPFALTCPICPARRTSHAAPSA